jgi:hypothetical protein
MSVSPEGQVVAMSETANRLEDVEKEISAEDAALDEARRRRREALGVSAGVRGVLGTYASGSVAMGVVNDPVEDADGGIILDRRQYPGLGPDGGGDTRDTVAELHELVGPVIREIWPRATVHDMNRGITVRMHAPLFSGGDPYVDVVVAMNRKDAPGLWIPNLAASCWDASHPQRHVELMLRQRLRPRPQSRPWSTPGPSKTMGPVTSSRSSRPETTDQTNTSTLRARGPRWSRGGCLVHCSVAQHEFQAHDDEPKRRRRRRIRPCAGSAR